MTHHGLALETELIRKCQAGEQRFYEPLVRANEAEGHRLALGILRDGDAGHAAVQQAFIKAYQSLDQFELGRSFRPWFLKILRNQCRDMLRRGKAGLEVQRIDEVLAERIASPSDPERDRGRSATREVLWQALGRISLDHREEVVDLGTGNTSRRVLHRAGAARVIR